MTANYGPFSTGKNAAAFMKQKVVARVERTRKKDVAVFQDEPKCHMFMSDPCRLNMLKFFYSNMLEYFMK